MSVNQIGAPPTIGLAEPPRSQQRGGDEPVASAKPEPAAQAEAERPEDQLDRIKFYETENEQIRELKLRIELDAASGKFVYFGIDIKSGEVVRQFPPEEALERIAFYRRLAGLVVDRST